MNKFIPLIRLAFQVTLIVLAYPAVGFWGCLLAAYILFNQERLFIVMDMQDDLNQSSENKFANLYDMMLGIYNKEKDDEIRKTF